MTNSCWFYLKNIFVNPAKAASGILVESRPWNVAVLGFILGVISYLAIVLMGYHALGWSEFPYREYYPHYFSPYWWEVFVVLIWGLVLALGYAVPLYYIGRLLRGQGTFPQVTAFILLASIVSLPLMVGADIARILLHPDWIVQFAKYGEIFIPPETNTLLRYFEISYAYVAMAWQGIVTVVGLTVIHKIRWFRNIPGLILGTGLFFGFLLAIKDYVALII